MKLLTGPSVLGFITCALSFTVHCLAQCSEAFQQGFSKYQSKTLYSVQDANSDFPNTKGPYKMIKGGQGPALTEADNKLIRGFFPKGKISGRDTGFTWYSMLQKEGEEYSMSYKVRFSNGFDWKKGGKLPGLCGGDSNKRGTACPVGCSATPKTRGFSTRLMWKEGGAITTYAYYPDKPSKIRCGEDWVWSKKLQAGKWHHIRITAKLNDANKANGEFHAWLDGAKVLNKQGIRYRYNDDFKISRAYITTYAGGSSRRLFAPSQDQTIEFDDFQVWEGSCSSPNGSPISSGTPPDDDDDGDEVDDVDSNGRRNNNDDDDDDDDEDAEDVPKKVRGFKLYRGAGWDLGNSGNIGRAKAKGNNTKQRIKFCARECDKLRRCVQFLFYNKRCYFKKDIDKKPKKNGKRSRGWPYLYVKN